MSSAENDSKQREVEEWQNRLRPLMVRMLVALAAFFFLASLVQLFYLHARIENAPRLDIAQLGCSGAILAAPGIDTEFACQRVRTAALLEANLVARRYHQLNVSMMSRVWTHYLGFVTGMILALVGATFVLGKIRDEGTEAGVKSEPWEVALKTASPGLVLCVLGVVLMIATIVVYHPIETSDKSIYFEAVSSGGTTGKPEFEFTPGGQDQKPHEP